MNLKQKTLNAYPWCLGKISEDFTIDIIKNWAKLIGV